jgi:hypothetical protein
MTARYSVVQYAPDPITDERINVGVIAWDEGGIQSRFLADWRRVQAFGGGNLNFLRLFAKKLQMLTSPQLRLALEHRDGFDAQRLETIIGSWEHNIQFTPPRGSIKDARALLADVVPTFLRESALQPRPRPKRDRRAAAVLTAKVILEAVQRRIADEAERLVKKNQKLPGRVEEHAFDVVLANGRPLAAVHALSFEVSDHERLERVVDATAWLVEDVKKAHAKLPVAIFALPPWKRHRLASGRSSSFLSSRASWFPSPGWCNGRGATRAS